MTVGQIYCTQKTTQRYTEKIEIHREKNWLRVD